MWSTFFVSDEEGRTVVPGAAGAVGAAAPGPAQGAAGLASLMSGRSTFGGNKRRRTTSTGHAMSEAQEGKVIGLTLCSFALQLHEASLEQTDLYQSLSWLFTRSPAGLHCNKLK